MENDDVDVLQVLDGAQLVRFSPSCRQLISAASLRQSEAVLGFYFHGPSATDATALQTFYERLKRCEPTRTFEIISIGADDGDALTLTENNPWLSLVDRDRKVELMKAAKVNSCPALVLVDAVSGSIITRNGHVHVAEDPDGKCFPWWPRSLSEILEDGSLVSNDGRVVVPRDRFKDCVKGLYFSAHWCPPCKAFTPQLVHTYNSLKEGGQRLEVIFVSSDRSRESFERYFSSMPWLAVPYDDERRRRKLASILRVQGIPTLVILDEKNKVLTRNGRLEIVDDPEGLNFPWRPRPVEQLTEKHSSKLNEGPCVILFTDGADKDVEQGRTLLSRAAERFNAECPSLGFFVGGDSTVCDSLREVAHLEDEVPLLVIVDIPKGKKYVFDEDTDVTEEVVLDFTQRFIQKELDGRPLQE